MRFCAGWGRAAPGAAQSRAKTRERSVKIIVDKPGKTMVLLDLRLKPMRRDVRVVEGTGLENRRCASIRGFESHSLRHFSKPDMLFSTHAEVPKWPKGLPC